MEKTKEIPKKMCISVRQNYKSQRDSHWFPIVRKIGRKRERKLQNYAAWTFLQFQQV